MTAKPRIGSLFSGAGGLDMAVEEVFGGRTVWHSEIDPAASKVLAHRFPGVPNLGDITAVEWADVPEVDVLCGGFPCQDVSVAGKRAGIKDGTRSGLWAVFAEAIDQLRPPIVVIENVRGLLSADGEPWPPEVVAAAAESLKWSRVLDVIQRKLNRAQRKGNWDNEYIRRKLYESARVAGLKQRAVARFRSLRSRLVQRAIGTVVAELSDLGYDAQWSVVSAASVGAPHRRERVFILASATDAPRDGWHQGRPESARLVGGSDAAVCCDEAVDLLPTPAACNPNDGEGVETWLARREVVKARVGNGNGMGMPLTIAVQLLPTPRSSDCFGAGAHGEGGLDLRTTMDLLCTPSAADAAGGHLNRAGDRRHEKLLPGQAREMATAWGKYEPAIRRWEAIVGPAPAPTEPNRNGKPRLNPAFSQWMMGWPARWVTDPGIGISRNDQLRIVGNGVVPQQAASALRYLLTMCEVAA